MRLGKIDFGEMPTTSRRRRLTARADYTSLLRHARADEKPGHNITAEKNNL